MKYLLIFVVCLAPVLANASCKYEARIRLGLMWYTVDIETENSLTRNQVISRLAKKYNFHDVGDIRGKCQ